MSSEERLTWVTALAMLTVPGWYFVNVLGRARNASVAEIDYQGTLLWNAGILIVAIIVGTIALTIAAAIGIAVSKEIAAQKRGEVSEADVTDADMEALERRDERDKDIDRFGGYVGSFVLGAAAIGALGLTMAEKEHFWIANSLYAGLVLSAIVSSVVKLVIYRR